MLQAKPIHLSTATPIRKQIAFIVDDVPHWQLLAQQIDPAIDSVILSHQGNALAQMADHLANHLASQHPAPTVQALHILSHSSPGQIHLGSADITPDTLPEHAPSLSRLAQSLAPGADILVYGCHTGQGPVGQQLIDALAQHTQARVAANTGPTGHAELGGQWALPTQSATPVRTPSLGAQGQLAHWPGLLMTTVTGTAGSDPQLDGGVDDDSISGLAGSDTLTGYGGADTLMGGDARDVLYGGAGNDLLIGGAQGSNADTDNNILHGEDGDDVLQGGNYAADGEYLYGGDDNGPPVWQRGR